MKQSSPSSHVVPLTRESLIADAVRRSIKEANPQAYVWSDQELNESLDSTLGEAPNRRHIWVFGYGSLLWNPLIDIVARKPGVVYGYRRRFCMIAPTGRGTPQNPGLILALDAGGSCQGIILKVNPNNVRSELELMWRREMVVGSYRPRWVTVRTEEGHKVALTFVMNRKHQSYRGKLPIQKIARTLASASGVLGSNADYLFDTLACLHKLGLDDKSLNDLARRVRLIQNKKKL
ncbi:MAG: gamma-glutamylcyclotransferase [Rhodospirillaceae bacterium]